VFSRVYFEGFDSNPTKEYFDSLLSDFENIVLFVIRSNDNKHSARVQ